MKNLLALEIGGYGEIAAPGNIPQGGLFMGKTTTLQQIIQNGLTIIISLTVLFSLIMIIWGGIMWITSNGDKSKVEGARKRIIYAIVGLTVVFLSFLIILMIEQLFGVDLIRNNSPVSNE